MTSNGKVEDIETKQNTDNIIERYLKRKKKKRRLILNRILLKIRQKRY